MAALHSAPPATAANTQARPSPLTVSSFAQPTDGFQPRAETGQDGYGNTITEHLMHISFMPHHRSFSQEELRLNDYNHGRGVTAISGRTIGFTNADDGVVDVVFSLTRSSMRHDSCRAPAGLTLPFTGGVVTITVGSAKNAQDFIVHREVVARRSAFVREAFKVAQEYERLVHCYMLGQKLLDSTFKDCIIDSTVSLLISTQVFNPSLSDLVYENTPDKSPLRKLWVDIYIFCGTAVWLDQTHQHHSDFLRELSKQQMSSRGGALTVNGFQALSEACRYHEHEGGSCYKSASMLVMNDGQRGVVSALWS